MHLVRTTGQRNDEPDPKPPKRRRRRRQVKVEGQT